MVLGVRTASDCIILRIVLRGQQFTVEFQQLRKISQTFSFVLLVHILMLYFI